MQASKFFAQLLNIKVSDAHAEKVGNSFLNAAFE